MNEINKNGLRIIKFIIRSQQILPQVYMRQIQVWEKQLELIRIDIDEWQEVTQILLIHKFIKEVDKKEYLEYMHKVFKELILEPLRKEIKEDPSKEKEFEKVLKAGAESFGFNTDIDEHEENEDYTKDIFTPEERKILKTDNQKEKIVKSDVVNRFKVLQDLIPLKRKLEKGFDIQNLGKHNLIYKEKEYKLIIGTKEINVKPTRRLSKQHQLLQYLFEQKLGEEYKYTTILDSRFMKDTNEVSEARQIKYYSQNLQKKIFNQSKIKDFLIISEKHVQINPEYLNES